MYTFLLTYLSYLINYSSSSPAPYVGLFCSSLVCVFFLLTYVSFVIFVVPQTLCRSFLNISCTLLYLYICISLFFDTFAVPTLQQQHHQHFVQVYFIRLLCTSLCVYIRLFGHFFRTCDFTAAVTPALCASLFCKSPLYVFSNTYICLF